MNQTTARKFSLLFLLLAAAAMGATVSTAFVPLSAVRLIKPDGRVIARGFSFTAAASRGSALMQVFALAESGDTIECCPGTFSGISSTLNLPAGASGFTLRGYGMGLTTLKLADAANVPLLSNSTIVTTAGGAITDKRITIENLTLDGNGQNQTKGTLSPVVAFKPILRLWGVDGVTIRNVKFFDPGNFCAWFGNWKNVVCDNIDCETAVGTIYTDGLHFNGSGQWLTIRNIRGNSYDDFLALNADDDANLYSPFSVNFNGAITDVLIDGWQMKDPLLGCRLLSSGTANGTGTGSVIDRVIVKNVTGTALNTILYADGYGGGDSKIGSVTLDTVDVDIHDPTVYVNGPAGVLVNQLVKRLTIRNFTKYDSPYVAPVLRLLGNGNISSLDVDGLHVVESTAAVTSQIVVESGAFVGNFNLSNVSSYNATKRTTGAILNNAGSLVFGLTASNCTLWQTGYLVYSTGACGPLTLSNIAVTANNPATLVDGIPVVQLSGAGATVTACKASNIHAASVVAAVSGATAPQVIGDANLAVQRKMIAVQFPGTLATGDGQAGPWRVPSELNGWNLVRVEACAGTASSSGTPTFQVRRVRSGTPVDVLSTALTLDANETDSSTAATAAVINASNDDLATADQWLVDCDVAGTGTANVEVTLVMQQP